jgi:hypothetical protein
MSKNNGIGSCEAYSQHAKILKPARFSFFSLIIFATCILHVVFASLLIFAAPHPSNLKRNKSIIVKTLTSPPMMTEQKPAGVVSRPSIKKPITPAPAATTQKPIAKTISKPNEKKITPKKETVSIKKPHAKEEKIVKSSAASHINEISPALLRELEESIAKIEVKRDKNKKNKMANVDQPAATQLQVDSYTPLGLDKAEDSDFVTALTQYLRGSLHLPDFGAVKIELTLQQDGSVAKLVVLKTESEKNKQYLERHLERVFC